MKTDTLAAVLLVILAPMVILWRRRDAGAGDGPWTSIAWPTDDPVYVGAPQSPAWSVDTADDMPDQLPGVFAATVNQAFGAVQDLPAALGLPVGPGPDVAARNERAALDTIAFAEGTSGANGYRMMFGGGLVDSLADHPRRFFTFTNKAGQTLRTSAAGRYQFLSRTWDALASKLNLPDFGPESQDRAALELIRERGALADVRAGRFESFIAKCAPVWASLPGAGYAQPERKLSQLVAAYTQAGGTLET